MEAQKEKCQNHIEHLEKLIEEYELANPGKTSPLRQPLEQQKSALDFYVSFISR